MAISGIAPAGAPAAAAGYSPGIVAQGERTLFISGQVPDDLSAGIEAQVREIFAKIGKVLHAAGGSFANVAMIRYYMADIARDLPVLRKVRLEFLKEPYPASTCVGVTALAIPGLQIEIEATAVL